MSIHCLESNTLQASCKIDDLPDEVLEYILSLVPPYKDLEECSLVCKRWLQSSKRVMCHTKKMLQRALSNFNVHWENITPEAMAPSITKRYSHSACRFKNSMYVFGGCTSTSTTFNDLWRLDLNRRMWVRPLTMGTYPSPKACATLVSHNESLILFGGWTHPSPYPLHQAWRLFNELHIYGTVTNLWSCINLVGHPPSMAGHSATIQGDLMIVFGGLQKTGALPGFYGSSNDVWVLNLDTMTWHLQPTSVKRPNARYGQSQIKLDDTHFLIIGGCGGPNMVYSDVWLLSMEGDEWAWLELEVCNQQWGAQHMWCHPACKVEDFVIVFSRHPNSGAPALPYTAQWNTPSHLRVGVSANVWVPPREENNANLEAANRRLAEGVVERPMDRDVNVNGRRGSLGRSAPDNVPAQPEPQAGPSNADNNERNVRPTPRPLASDNDIRQNPMAAFRDHGSLPRHPTPNRQRQLQLESLRRMEERIRAMSRGPVPPPQPTSETLRKDRLRPPKNPMTLFTLDISRALTGYTVEWLPFREDRQGGPEETILYSLVAGKGEVIMFGGIQKDATSITVAAQESNTAEKVSNSLHFVTGARGII